MKKLSGALLICMAAVLMFGTFSVYGAGAQLESIEFKNATVEEQFSSDKFDYTLRLSNPKVTPTLKDYKIIGDANIFVTYSYDNAKHQTGAVVTLEYENGSAIYTFNYRNAEFYEKSNNNYLRELGCNLGVVYPELNHDNTDYRIYIPNDLTVLNISAATEDIGAYCEVPTEISLSAEQELDIPLIVNASNGEKRTYSFEVQRCDKTSEEFDALVKSGNTDILVKSERFYQKPVFLISLFSAAGGLLIIWLLVKIAKRLTIEVNDEDENEFFDTEN